ncbi:MAG: SDR family oxidoreductase [Gammaproteobacteria bacterium]|nr:SDR family oxidoreductase [Gammaproteobacteria bacterium]MDH5305024.1 SDR family oxidoreductase [Gammaproteobacteria bacterium]
MVARLNGKTCIVTAAGQGIGRAVAEAFQSEGADTIAVDLNASALDSWAKQAGTRCVVMDVTDQAAVARLAADISNAAVLVNCVGMVEEGNVLDASVEELEKSFRINVSTMHIMIKHFLPQMRARREGSIINIASVVSSVIAAPNRFVYGTTKAAVIGLTKSVARDFIAEGIRCNSISPGTVESPSLQARIAAKGQPDKVRAEFIARQPMGRIGAPEEIAAVAVLLASDEARFMTGENIVIDGGMSL